LAQSLQDVVVGEIGSSAPTEITAANSPYVYFSAAEKTSGRELYRTSGTAAGTILVKDIAPGRASSDPQQITYGGNGMVYFVADDGTSGFELWRSDGTSSGTLRLADLNSGSGSTVFGSIVALNPTSTTSSIVYVVATTASSGTELYYSSGSTLAIVTDLFAGTGGSNPAFLTAINGVMYFQAQSSSSSLGVEFYKSTSSSSITLVADIDVGAPSSNPNGFVLFNGFIYFVATTAAAGTELFKSTGSGRPTLIDIFPGTASSSPSWLTVMNSVLYFSATVTTTIGAELYMLSTTDVVTILKDIEPTASTSSLISQMFTVNSRLYFSGRTLASGTELFTSDGTAAGTVLVRSLASDADSVTIQDFVYCHAVVYFRVVMVPGTSPSPGDFDLYQTDGTAANTVSAHTKVTTKPVCVSNVLYFAAENAESGLELWKIDGNRLYATLVKDINTGGEFVDPRAGSMVQFSSTGGGSGGADPIFLFAGYSSLLGYELWRTDGRAAGTYLVKDIYPGAQSSTPTDIVIVGTNAYFAATDAIKGNELFRSDGTAAGTHQLGISFIKSDFSCSC